MQTFGTGGNANFFSYTFYHCDLQLKSIFLVGKITSYPRRGQLGGTALSVLTLLRPECKDKLWS